MTDISDLPVPPKATKGADISDLPVPSSGVPVREELGIPSVERQPEPTADGPSFLERGKAIAKSTGIGGVAGAVTPVRLLSSGFLYVAIIKLYH
jgi:hypothetical protein